MTDLLHLLKIWIKMSTFSMQTAFANRFGALLFISAKITRFVLFFATISIVFPKTHSVVGFTRDEVILLFFVFTLLDSISQLLFREVYRFRSRVVSGDFDLDLLKPLPSLFRPLLGGADPLDLITLIPFTLLFVGWTLHLGLGAQMGQFLILMLNALIIAASFHIIVLAFGILTTQVDHLIMIYRDVWNMGRFPTQIYTGGLALVLTTVIPVAVMVTIPTQVLLGRAGSSVLFQSLLIGVVFLLGSIRLWKYALRHYTSASS